MAKENLITTQDLDLTARKIDFVTRFGDTWQHLKDVLGVMRLVKKAPGTTIKSKTATVTLQNGDVAEGEEIPYSAVEIKEKDYDKVSVQKFSAAVTLEAINDYGYDVAVQMTDDAFLAELQGNVTNKFYAYLKTGELTDEESTWQRALAMAKGAVLNKFKKIHKTATKVVGFANVMDLYDYLGDKDITVQSEHGFTYIKNFLGYDTIFLLSDEEIPTDTVIATPVENVVLYYVDPSAEDFAKAGLAYTVDDETPLIGLHIQGKYGTAVSELFAIMGMTLFAEYQDGIAVYTVAPSV